MGPCTEDVLGRGRNDARNRDNDYNITVYAWLVPTTISKKKKKIRRNALFIEQNFGA